MIGHFLTLSANIASELNHTEPQAWLTQTLVAIMNGHKQSDIDQLLPWNYNESPKSVYGRIAYH
jgi:hypothetical protein